MPDERLANSVSEATPPSISSRSPTLLSPSRLSLPHWRCDSDASHPSRLQLSLKQPEEDDESDEARGRESVSPAESIPRVPSQTGYYEAAYHYGNCHQDHSKRVSEDVTAQYGKDCGSKKREPKKEAQSERPMPEHIHTCDGNRKGQPDSPTTQSPSPPLTRISEFSRKPPGH